MTDLTETAAVTPGLADPEPSIPRPRGPATATKIALDALASLLQSPTLPSSLDSSEDRLIVSTTQHKQLDAAWRTLRSRYPTTLLGARSLHEATTRATRWVDDLLSPHVGPESTAEYGLARLALISAVTRRLIIDGIDAARGSVAHYRAGLGGGAPLETPPPGPEQTPVSQQIG